MPRPTIKVQRQENFIDSLKRSKPTKQLFLKMTGWFYPPRAIFTNIWRKDLVDSLTMKIISSSRDKQEAIKTISQIVGQGCFHHR